MKASPFLPKFSTQFSPFEPAQNACS